MNSDERFAADTDEQELPLDPLLLALAAALADEVLAPLPDDMDAEAAAAALTPEDRQALASLRGSAELVRKVIETVTRDNLELATADPACDGSTLCAAPDATVPLPGSPFWPGDALPQLDELMTRLEAVQQAEQISWTSCYRKLEELGRGGQGVVYLTECLDELSGEQALKFYSPQPYPSAGTYREDMQRLLQVASLVHRIHHDNLVDVQRFVDYQGIYVMVMQWIDGFDLRRLLDLELLDQVRQHLPAERWAYLNTIIYARPAPRRVCLQPLVAVNIIEKCLRGLSALHEKGIVHGDIKPSNIMVDCNGSIRLIDIGSAYRYEAPPRQRIWTPRYAPPEFLERGEWTPKSDLASLGYVLIELMSGRTDFAGPRIGDQSTRTGDRHRDDVLLEAKRCLPQRLLDILPDNVSRCEKLLQLCRKLIDPDPNNRYECASEAIAGNGEGTWDFRMDLARVNLAVHEASAIKRWVEDVKNVVS